MFDRQIFASLTVVLGLVAAPVLAQPAARSEHQSGGAMMNAGGMPSGMMSMMRGDEGMGAMGGMRIMMAMTGHVEGRLAFLKTELQITDAQLMLWNKFADAVRDNAKAMNEMMQGGTMETSHAGTLPDKLAVHEKMMTAHLDALRKLTTALDPLYAALNAEQKKTADELRARSG